MSGQGFEIFGFVASVVSLVALTQLIYAWLKDAVPSAKMRALDALLCDTEAFLHSALEEGTIDYAQYDSHFRTHIWSYVFLSLFFRMLSDDADVPHA